MLCVGRPAICKFGKSGILFGLICGEKVQLKILPIL